MPYPAVAWQRKIQVPGHPTFKAQGKHHRITPFSTGRGETAARFLASPGPRRLKTTLERQLSCFVSTASSAPKQSRSKAGFVEGSFSAACGESVIGSRVNFGK